MPRKNIGRIIAVLIALAVIGALATLLLPHLAERGSLAKEFTDAIVAGDGEKVKELAVPQAADGIDAPLVKCIPAYLKEHLGEYRGVAPGTLQWVRKLWASDAPGKFKCTLDFQNGQATVLAETRGDRVASFQIVSPQLPVGWQPVPGDTQYWRDQGKEFLEAYAEARADDAFAMMHPALQKKVTIERLRLDVEADHGRSGKLQFVKFLSETRNMPSGKTVTFRYRYTAEKLAKEVELTYEFAGFKGWLVGVAPADNKAATRSSTSPGGIPNAVP